MHIVFNQKEHFCVEPVGVFWPWVNVVKCVIWNTLLKYFPHWKYKEHLI